MSLAQDWPHLQVLEFRLFQIGEVLLHHRELDFAARHFLRQRFVLNFLAHLNHVNVAGYFIRQLDERAAISRLLRKIHCPPRELRRPGYQSRLDINFRQWIGRAGLEGFLRAFAGGRRSLVSCCTSTGSVR